MREKTTVHENRTVPAAGKRPSGPVAAICCKEKTAQKKNTTGMPDEVKSGMESAFNTDFSGVKVHASSSKAPEVGALAYTQGSDIHFAPGQYKPDTTSGRELLGHELTHVVQQSEGRVSPTCEVAGMPVNDDHRLEAEADSLGKKAAAGI